MARPTKEEVYDVLVSYTITERLASFSSGGNVIGLLELEVNPTDAATLRYTVKGPISTLTRDRVRAIIPLYLHHPNDLELEIARLAGIKLANYYHGPDIASALAAYEEVCRG